ncbi:ribonuclease P/MRP protein subunit POP6 [Lachancea thermotolerans CBS 6340]|uniref:KLTH0G17842p n=1 Tax=Lachancea thermotolerans (strain ATCC 56472 / CBS 6340 / NRRL Y-8284) TaxID=559295 RepID=C5DNK7_LACTC|nr:KLTH0G17842p [Lachancea thermotolerans CBS 6340]CAR25368.1 KLTH0G17842p [Lachancea thermotolerans CBS 6340]
MKNDVDAAISSRSTRPKKMDASEHPSHSGGQLLYLNAETGLEASDSPGCFQYIADKVLPSLLGELDLPKCYVRYLSKNTKIEEYVADLASQFADNKALVLYSYGSHVQKAVTIIELAKRRIAVETPGAGLDHRNKLSRFVNIVPGRNELLERKINVPILVALITRKTDAPLR